MKTEVNAIHAQHQIRSMQKIIPASTQKKNNFK